MPASLRQTTFLPLFLALACAEGPIVDAQAPVPIDGGSCVEQRVSRTRYQSATVPPGELCIAETQMRVFTCDDPGWSNWSGTFDFDTCAAEVCTRSCDNGGQCIWAGGEQSCQCVPPFAGPYCREPATAPTGYDGLRGYIAYDATQPPEGFSYGMGFYAAAWSLIERPIANFQIGLPGSWVLPNNDDQWDSLCPVGTLARDAWPERGPTWSSVFQTLEGGLGYWAGNRFRYGPPKFSMNATPQCYDYQVASPGWSFFGSSDPLPDDRLSVAQLSNRILIPPDGLTFAGNPHGDFLGYSWMALPFTRAIGGAYPTGEHSWTCFLNSRNFSGPIAFYIPETWSKVGRLFNHAPARTRGLDSRLGQMHGGAMEINTVPYFQATGSAGHTYTKIPALRFPVDDRKRSVLVQDVRYYSREALFDAVLAWRDQELPAPTAFRDSGSFRARLSSGSAGFSQANQSLSGVEQVVRTEAFGDYAWGLRWLANTDGRWGHFPQYLQLDSGTRRVVREATVATTALAHQVFPEASPGSDYAAQIAGAWAAPGPASEAQSVTLADGTEVYFRWYRFIDQPSFQQYDWSPERKERLQRLIEAMHRHWTIDRTYMAPPQEGNLVALDPQLIVTPPPQYAVGYVPIVVRQSPRP